MDTPFFSIGITTYRQRGYLGKALESILGQNNFRDFEIVVGNDNPGEPFSAEDLGVRDERIRILNHPVNLGERENMNALLAAGRGRYFTWLADDDYYAPEFLESAHSALARYGFPPCVFTSFRLRYDIGPSKDDSRGGGRGTRLYSGREFLRLYLSGKLKAMGTCGFYDAEYLRAAGGVEKLGEGPFALYSEYLLLMRAGLLEKVAFVDAPLVVYRIHRGSWGCTNQDIAEYRAAGENLIRKSLSIFRHSSLAEDFPSNVADLCRMHRSTLVGKGLHTLEGRLREFPSLLLHAREAEAEIRRILAREGVPEVTGLRGAALADLMDKNRLFLLLRLLVYGNWKRRMLKGTNP